MYRIHLKEGRNKLPEKHHPWVFSGAIGRIEPAYAGADWAEVMDSDSSFIAWGWYDEESHIILRLISWHKKETPGDDLVRKLVRESILRRRQLLSLPDTTALRIIHGDADFLPGLAADVYGTEVRIIISSRFSSFFLPVIAKEIDRVLHPSVIEACTDRQYAESEKLSERIRWFRNGEEKSDGERDPVLFLESGIYYSVQPGKGQKSGFYCDQRENRIIAGKYASGRKVLDLFSYTGAFALHALKNGASSVHASDSSESALRHLLYEPQSI